VKAKQLKNEGTNAESPMVDKIDIAFPTSAS